MGLNKKYLLIFGLVLVSLIVLADNDYFDDFNMNEYSIYNISNLTADYLEGNLTWDSLYDYPVSCPAYTAITQLDDSVTCTSYELVSTLNVTGNASVGGYLHIGTDGAISDFFTRPGDLYLAHTLFSNQGIISRAENYGISLMAEKSGGGFNFSGTASFTAQGTIGNYYSIICDTSDPFIEEHIGKFLTVSSDTATCSYGGGTGEINSFINTTCIEINVASAGLRTLTDATDCPYSIYDAPPFLVLDRGAIYAHIGKNADAKLGVKISDGRGTHGFYIDDTAGADQHRAMTIDMDIKDYDGIVALNIFGKSSTGISGTSSEFILMESDATGINNSDLTYITMATIGEGGDGNHLDGIKASSNIDDLIHVGSADTINSAYYEAINVTQNFTNNGGVPATVFVDDNDVVYIGSTVNFTDISFALETPSSHNLGFTYQFCNQSGYYSIPIITDTTDGFKVSGSISFTNPDGRGTCYNQTDGTAFSDTNNYTYIALTRTINNIVTAPIVNLVSIAGSEDLFTLAKDMMKVNPVDTAPKTCSAATLGGMYFDISEDSYCQCTSGGWKVMHDNSECT